VRTDALIGIFWLVRDDYGQIAMPMRTCSLDKAEDYGNCLTFGEGHYETWEAWKEDRLRFDPSSSGLRRAVLQSEYEEWPRGRVVHQRTSPARFIVYADRQLFPHRAWIMNAFGLPPERTWMRTDAHYQSTKRIACPSERMP